MPNNADGVDSLPPSTGFSWSVFGRETPIYGQRASPGADSKSPSKRHREKSPASHPQRGGDLCGRMGKSLMGVAVESCPEVLCTFYTSPWRAADAQQYVERATSAFFASPFDPIPMSTFDAFHAAGVRRLDAAKAWLARLASRAGAPV